MVEMSSVYSCLPYHLLCSVHLNIHFFFLFTDTKDKDKCQRAFDGHKCSYEKDPDVCEILIVL